MKEKLYMFIGILALVILYKVLPLDIFMNFVLGPISIVLLLLIAIACISLLLDLLLEPFGIRMLGGDIEYRHCILRLIAGIIKSDGHVSGWELERVKGIINRYYKTKEEQEEANKYFREILTISEINDLNEIKYLCRRINSKFNYSAKSELIMELLAVAYADGDFQSCEKFNLGYIRSYLKISLHEYNSIKAIFLKKFKDGQYQTEEDIHDNEYSNQKDISYNKSDKSSSQNEANNLDTQDSRHTNESENHSIIKEAYEILGVNADASDEEIKKAYRVLTKKHHPDKASKLGEEALRQATETMKQINVAWETVKEARGMK